MERCPLCSAQIKSGVLEHLEGDHRRTEFEARKLMERAAAGTLGWDPETKKKREISRERASS